MEKIDLGVAFLWEYDDGFISLIREMFRDAGLTTYIVSGNNISKVKEKIHDRQLSFDFYLDRAWDVDEEFEALGKILSKRRTHIFNPYHNVLHAIDKASMHLEFITAGINVPYSIIIPPHSEKAEIFISLDDLAHLGRPFIIKPCNTTGGGVGVVTGAESLKEILDERISNIHDKYILQEKIYPAILEGNRAWFRCFWSFGTIIPVWWDDQTHLYKEMKSDEIVKFKLRKLIKFTNLIAENTKLDFFSTEFVLTEDNKFIAIDYVNDQCDMRLSSQHRDGVPDNVIRQIIKSMIREVIKGK
ncbi:MAG TPA: hypothetical protein VMV32_03850 [Ignavibacteriaceae bacterium]|nr:hypothetical protein [Ignavibacteriaceae bacterium]